MAFEKKLYDCKILFLVLIGIPLIASTNIDCGGKPFYCVNSTHFMICVDLGGGVSITVDDLVISCPPSTLCQGTNRFECEFPVKTTPMPQTQVTEVTNEISTQQWEEIVVTTKFPKNASREQIDQKYVDGTNLTTVADVTTDVPLQNTSSLNANEIRTENNLATTESTYKSTIYTEANNVHVTIANANESINTLENNKTNTHIVGPDVVSGLITIDTKTTLISEITDNLLSATHFTDADNNINSTENFVTLNTITETTTIANKPSLLNNNSRDSVNTTNLNEDIYFTTSIPDLVVATTMEEKMTQPEILTPLIFDGVQTTTDTITTVSEYSTGLVNISEHVDNKTGPVKENEMENVVTTTASLIFITSLHSTSSNLINETAINTGSDATETNNTTIGIVSANTPGINDVTDPPTTELIMTNTKKYVNSNNNIPEITTDTIAINIDSIRDMLFSGIVITTDVSYTEGDMAAVENINSNGSAIAAGDSITTKKTNKEMVTANPVIEVFISNTTEMPTNSDLPRSEIVTFVSSTIPSDIKINVSSINSNPQIINLNETTVTTENIITQTGKNTVQQSVTNVGNESIIEKNLTSSKNISKAQSTSQVTSMWSSTDVTNRTDKATVITSLLSNNQSVTEAPDIIISDFQVTTGIDIKQKQPINLDLEKTQNENQKTEDVQSSSTNKETIKESWSASTIVETSTTATTTRNDIYLHQPEDKQIEEITTTINSNINILEVATTTNPTDVVSRTTATAKEIEYTLDPNVGIPYLMANNASNTSPKLEGSVNEPTKVNMDSTLKLADNNEANNLMQTINTKMVSEENLTTSRTFVTMTELNQENTSIIASSASPHNNLETVSTTLPSPTSVLSIYSESNFTNGTGIDITSTITPLNTISTEIDQTVTVTNVKTEPKVDNPLQNVLLNIDFSTEILPARDVRFQTPNTFTATNNAFGKTTNSYVEDNQSVTTQDTMIILTTTSDGLASHSSKTNALDDPKQIVQGATTEPFDGIRNPTLKEDGIVTVNQTVDSSTSDQHSTFLTNQAQFVTATTNDPLGGLVNSQVQTSSSPMNGQQDSLGSSQAQAGTSLTTDQLYSLVDSEAQTGSSTTNNPQGGFGNSKAQTGSSSTNAPQGGLGNSQALTGSSQTDEPQGGLVNSQAQTGGSSTNAPQGGLVNSQAQIGSSSTNAPQGGLGNSQALTESSSTNDPQGGLVNNQAQTGSSLTDGPHGGLVNSQAQTESSSTNDPQGSLVNSQAQTESSPTGGQQGGLVNSQAQTESSSTNDPQGGLVSSQAQTESSLTDGQQGGLVNSQAQTESSSINDPQGGLGNSQAHTGSSPTDDPQGSLVNSQAQTEISPSDGPQGGLVNSQAHTESSSTIGTEGGLGNNQTQTESSSTNDPQGSLVNSQAQTESAPTDGTQGGLVNSQAQTESSSTIGTQGGLVNSQAQTESSSTIGPQGGLEHSQAQIGCSPTDGPQGGLLNSQAQTRSSPTDGQQGGLVNSQAQTESSKTDGTQGGLGNIQTQKESSSTIGPQGGLVNSQAQTESSSINDPQFGLGLGNSQAQTGSSSTNATQGGLGNSQVQTGSSSTNVPQGGLEISQAQTGSSRTDGPQGGLGNSPAQTGSSPTNVPQGGLGNSQAQTGSSPTDDPQGGVVNGQVQTESSLTNGPVGSSPTNVPKGGLRISQTQTESYSTIGPQGSLVNSQAQTGSSPTDGQQGGLGNSQAQTGSSPSDDPQGGLVNSLAQTGSSPTNVPQGGLGNSQAQTGSSPTDDPQGGLVNSQAQTGSSPTNVPQGGLGNSQAQTGSSPTDDPQGGLVNSQAQTGSSPTNVPQGGLGNSQAQTGSSPTDGPQGGIVNSQAKTGSSLTNVKQGGFVNSQTQTGRLPTDGPQSSVVNGQVQTESSLTNGPVGSSPSNGLQGGFVNSQAATESVSTNDQEDGLVNSQAQKGTSFTLDQTHRLVNNQVQTGSSSTNGLQDGLGNSQAQTESSSTIGPQGGLVNSQAATGSYLANSLHGGLGYSQAQTDSSFSNGPEGGLISSQATTESSLANGPQGGFVNSQTQIGSSHTNDQQYGLVNSQVQTGSSSTNGPQTSIVGSQAQTMSTATNGQQKGFVNKQATTGSFSTNGQQDGFVDSQIQLGSSFTTDQTHSFVDSQAQTASLTTNSPQNGLLNSPAQIQSKGTSYQQNGLVNSQVQTTSLLTNGQQNELVNSQTHTANPPMNGQQNNVVNSQVQVGSTSINMSEKGLVNSQAQTTNSTTNGLNGFVNSQVQAASSKTTGQQNSLVNSQAQTTSLTTNNQQNGAVNNQVLVASTMAGQLNSRVQATSTVTNGQPNGLVNNQAQTRITTASGQQNGVVNIEVQTTSTLINGQQNDLVTSQVQVTKTNGPESGLVNSHTRAGSELTNGKQNGLVNITPGFTLNGTLKEDNKTSTDSIKVISTFDSATYNSLGIGPAYPDSSVDKNKETKLSEPSHLENTLRTNNAVIQPVTAMPLFEGKRQIPHNVNVDEVTVSSIYVSTTKLLSTGGVDNNAPLKTTILPLAYNQHETVGEFQTQYAATTVMESSLRENPIIYTTAGGLYNANRHLSSLSINKSPTENYEPVTGKHFPAYQGGSQYGGKVEKSTQGGPNNENDQVETITESMKSTVEENVKRFSISIAITPASEVPTPGGNSTIKASGNKTKITPVNLETTVSTTQTTRNGDVDKFNKTPEVMQTSEVVTKRNSGVSHVEATKKPFTFHTVINTEQKMSQDSLTNLRAVDNINQEIKVEPNIIPDLIQRVTDSQNAGQLPHATLSPTVENTTKKLVTLQTEVTTSRSIAKTSVNKNDPIVTQQTMRYLTTSAVKPTTSSKHQVQSSSVKPALNSDTVTNSNQKGAAKKTIFTCKDRLRSRYSDPDDCRKFYICSGLHEPIIGLCPVNTVFSEIKTQCTKNLSHCIRNNQFKCVSKGRFSDYLQPNTYYICVQNTMHNFIRFKFQCQMGYYLNKTTVRCLKIPEVVNLLSSFDNISKSTVETISDEDKKSKEKTKPKKGDDFECEKQGKFADENNCRKYYVCSKSKKSEEFRRRMKKCDSDEVFHKDKKKCVDAESYEC